MIQNSYPIACPLTLRETTMTGIRKAWRFSRDRIAIRLAEFDTLWKNGSEEMLFAELAFCLMTPQSKALNCWAAVKNLYAKGLLLNGNADRIAPALSGVRFHNTKAARIVLARRQFMRSGRLAIREKIGSFDSIYAARDWFVANVLGLGYKEASHFLRNIGFYEKICILDRHILRNLKAFGVIDEIPSSLQRQRYIAVERKMQRFAKELKMPASHLDLLLWCRETGAIFK
jgi:N-glycosylase/DNA lyase